MRKAAAVGVDGMTNEQYGQDLEVRLEDLHARLRTKRYRHHSLMRQGHRRAATQRAR